MDKCPLAYADAGTFLALKAQRRAEKGVWPIAGGWLDQTQSILDAVEFVEIERARAKATAEAEN